MTKVSAYIITYNEQHKIAAAVNSVIGWADEVIVADSNSTDDTAKIAASLGAKVIQVPFQGFGKLRNDTIVHCQYPWIFSLDADERCTPEARDEMLQDLLLTLCPGEIFSWDSGSNIPDGTLIIVSPSFLKKAHWCIRMIPSMKCTW
jgi:glycosyltransferase involved in cell wall biosynthesis